MEIQEILKELEVVRPGNFPRKALQEAIKKREEITPELLKVMERAITDIDKIVAQPSYMLHIYAMYLLAQFREAHAYPLLVKFFSIPGEVSLDVTGDVVTEDLQRILASVCHGDDAPLKSLIENKDVNEYVRSSALQSLLVLVNQGVKTRDEVMDYFKSLFQGKLEQENSFMWASLVISSDDLYPEEVYEDIKQAYQNNRVNETIVHLKNVKSTMAEGKEKILEKLQKNHHISYIDDTIAEMEHWACFLPVEKPRPRSPKQSPARGEVAAWETIVNTPKVGRNEPCPCGSGRKYKHCCGKRQ